VLTIRNESCEQQGDDQCDIQLELNGVMEQLIEPVPLQNRWHNVKVQVLLTNSFPLRVYLYESSFVSKATTTFPGWNSSLTSLHAICAMNLNPFLQHARCRHLGAKPRVAKLADFLKSVFVASTIYGGKELPTDPVEAAKILQARLQEAVMRTVLVGYQAVWGKAGQHMMSMDMVLDHKLEFHVLSVGMNLPKQMTASAGTNMFSDWLRMTGGFLRQYDENMRPSSSLEHERSMWEQLQSFHEALLEAFGVGLRAVEVQQLMQHEVETSLRGGWVQLYPADLVTLEKLEDYILVLEQPAKQLVCANLRLFKEWFFYKEYNTIADATRINKGTCDRYVNHEYSSQLVEESQ